MWILQGAGLWPERFVRGPGPLTARLHFDVHEGAGPPLLLVHGFLSSRGQWAANLAGLRRFATPVTVELWGHGRSPAPEDPAQYDPLAYVEQFEAIRQEVGGERWYVCGQSFGAGLTLRYSLERPEAFIGQAFTNSLSGLGMAEEGAAADRRSRLKEIVASGAPLTEIPFHPDHGARLHAAVRTVLAEDAQLLARQALLLGMEHTRPRSSVRTAFGRIRVPTLMVQGVWERNFRPLAAFAATALPGLKAVRLEGGHSINAEAVEAFDSAIGAHLADCLDAYSAVSRPPPRP